MYTTFLLDAGINCAVSRTDDNLNSPLARNFFSQALQHPRFEDFSHQTLSPLLNFIQKYWRLDRKQLAQTEFDLEKCYTFIELQRREAFLCDVQKHLTQAVMLVCQRGDHFRNTAICVPVPLIR